MSEQPSADQHRAFALEAQRGALQLLEASSRSPEEDEEMLRRAYAAAYHWGRTVTQTPEDEARACYLVGRVHLELGDAARALHYGERALAQCSAFGIGDVDLVYAYELTARALDALGRSGEAAVAWHAAHGVPIADPEDRAQVAADLSER